MANGSQKRTRSERVAAIDLPPSALERTMLYLRSRDVLARIGLCALVALVMWVMMAGWNAPFPYRPNFVPTQDIVARVPFDVVDDKATQDQREKAKSQAIYVYDQDASELIQRRAELRNLATKATTSATVAEFGADVWDEFLATPAKGQPALTAEQKDEAYQRFRDAFTAEGKLAKFDQALTESFAPFAQRGLLSELPAEHKGNQLEIDIRDAKQPDFPLRVKIAEVLLVEAAPKFQKELAAHVDSLEVAERCFTWLQKRLPNTLKMNQKLSDLAVVKAETDVKPVTITIKAGESLAKLGEPLNRDQLDKLHREYNAFQAKQTFGDKTYRSLAVLGMFLALFTLCGYYIFHRERRLLVNVRRFTLLMGLCTGTIGLCLLTARDEWRAELIPLLLFGMTVAIAYQQELALLLSAALSLTVVIALGQGLAEFVILLSGAAGAILLLGRIRTRSKLIYVGLCAAAVVGLTTLGVRLLSGQVVDMNLITEASRNGLWAIVAGFLVTGLLPFIENLFEVLTDISLLELGDIAHPLLQELVRRAPGTYNHSINVASIAEAACEAIGAHGLLTRVGAYFHDIGKMLKPAYFIENQGNDANRHESLAPAMSTLVIIAHIKDGADLARQHHLPQPIIDFIQQHHGTTLVEYFYRRASELSENDPFSAEVDENAFRYPGPKPQTKEAGVLMIADAVESASRTLVEPTPARIESLVHDIAMKRLLDGQFDECGLTLEEVHVIEDSLVKSLTAVYHGRVKYPEQRTA